MTTTQRAIDRMTEREIWRAALSRAPYGGESRTLAALRTYVHAQMLDGRLDGDITDRIGEMLDVLSHSARAKVGDIIGPNATAVPWDVVELVDDEGTTWTRALDGSEALDEDGTSYPWFSPGGLCSNEGIIHYAPAKVTRVVVDPDPTRDQVRAVELTDVAVTRFTVERDQHGNVLAWYGKAKIGAVWGPSADGTGEYFCHVSMPTGLGVGPDGRTHNARHANAELACAALLHHIGIGVEQ
jgi:hypothetical protein